MPRPPLPLGTWGKIRRTELSTDLWRATAQFRDSDGVTRPVTATGKTGASAERALVTRLKDRAAPAGEFITSETRVSELAKAWLDEAESGGHILEQTLEKYRHDVENRVNPAIGALRIREASVGRVDKLLKDLAKKHTSVPRQVKTVLSQMFDMAVRHQAIAVNPVRSTARTRKVKKEVRIIDLSDLNAVRDAVRNWQGKKRPGPKANDDLADITDAYLGTGARIGEVLAIRWEDVDLAACPPTVTIAGTLVTLKGQGTFRQPWTKSEAGYRTLVMPKFMVDMMMRRRVASPANNPYGAVFVTRNGTWKTPNNVRRQWRDARAGTGFEWVTPHVFRKTVATLIDDQVDSAVAAKVLGHASDQVTKRYYIAKPELAPDVSSFLDTAFAPPTPG